jgi:hypothetical protein
MSSKIIDQANYRAMLNYLEMFDDFDAPDGTWHARLCQGVEFWNENWDTDYDPEDAVLDYLRES